MGAQTTYNADTDRAVVNGAHTDDTLQNLIHRYCETFVICPQCGLPETDYKIKNECIYHKCAACGNKEMVDMSHKLVTFILAQDKKAKKEAKSKSKKEGKDGKKKGTKKPKSADGGGSGSDEDGKKKKKDKKKDKKAKKDKKEKKSTSDNSSGNHLEDAIFGDDKDEFGEDIEEASLASEPGVDDAGAMRKSTCLYCAIPILMLYSLTHVPLPLYMLLQSLLWRPLASISTRTPMPLPTILSRLSPTSKWLPPSRLMTRFRFLFVPPLRPCFSRITKWKSMLP